MNVIPLLLTAVTGGLAGSIFTLSIQSFVRWWTRPILSATFQSGEPGCEVLTPATKIDEKTGIVIAQCQQKYLRLRIENRGLSFARNVSVCVTCFEYTAAGVGRTNFAEEVFELPLSLVAGGRTVFNFAAQQHRFVDLVHTEVCISNIDGFNLPPPQAGCGARRCFDFPTPVRLEDLGWTRGTYRIVVFVCAENAKPFESVFQFSWDGSLEGLRINHNKGRERIAT